MKKITSVILSIVILLSTVTCLNFSASANDKIAIEEGVTAYGEINYDNKKANFTFTPSESGYYSVFVSNGGNCHLSVKYGNHSFSSSAEQKQYYEFTQGNEVSITVSLSSSYPISQDEVLSCEVTITKHEHNFQLYSSRTATCTKEGYEGYICYECYSIYEDTVPIDPNAHSFQYGACTLCGADDPDFINPQIDVKVGESAVANLDIKGETAYFTFVPEASRTYLLTCKSQNGNLFDFEFTDSQGNILKKQSATGQIDAYDLIAGETYTIKTNYYQNSYTGTITLTIEEHDHNYTVYSVKNATCSAKGSTIYHCNACGSSYSEEIPIDPDAHRNVNGQCTYCGTIDESYVKVITEAVDGEKYSVTSKYSGENAYFTFTPSENADYEIVLSATNLKYTLTDSNGNNVTYKSSSYGGIKILVTLKAGEAYSLVTTPSWAGNYSVLFQKHEHNIATKKLVEPECNSSGSGEFYCSYGPCDYSYKEYYAPTGEHEFKTEVIKPTCTASGYTVYQCANCYIGYICDYTPIDTNAHSYKNGFCEDCFERDPNVAIPEITLESSAKVSLSSKKDEAYVSFTPKETGYYSIYTTGSYDTVGTLYDSDMNELADGDDRSSSNYNYVIYARLVAGETYYVQSSVYDYEAGCSFEVCVNTHTHKYKQETSKPTCGDKGYTLYYCTYCYDYYYTDYKPATGVHSFTLDEKVPATCTEQGYSIYYCTKCYETKQADFVPATGKHSYLNNVCKVCGERKHNKIVTLTQDIYPDVDVNVVFDAKNELAVLHFTPEESGTYILKTNGYYDTYGMLYDENSKLICEDDDGGLGDNCQFVYDFEAGKTYTFKLEVCNFESGEYTVSLTKHNHDFATCVIPPTCSGNGYTIYSCKDCFDSYESDYTDKLSKHNYNNGICEDCGRFDNSYPFEKFTYTGTKTVNAYETGCFKFTPAEDNEYTFTANSKCDTIGIIVDEEANIIAYDMGSGDAFDFKIVAKLKAGTTYYLLTDACSLDYTVTLSSEHVHSYKKVINAPTCTEQGYTIYTCIVCGDEQKKDFVESTHNYQTIVQKKATLTQDGSMVTKCSECGNVSKTTAIYYPKTITLSTASYTYNGKAQKPTVKVVDSNGKTVASSNYTVSYPSDCKNVGSYNVTIKFKGNYSGTATKTFKINPNNTSISSVTAKSKGFTVNIKKYTTQTTGYQIQYSTSSNFKNAKTITVKNTVTSKTISKLTAKKKYFVRIRTYKTVGKTNYYSAWSSYKKVTTKK